MSRWKPRVSLPGLRHDAGPGRLRADLVAGLTVWAVLIPESLAYATIAGVSPVVGLYAAVPSLVIYAVLGSSRHLVVAPMSATAALSATVAATYSDGAAADYLRVTITLTLVVGVLGVLAGLLRLGFLSTFISNPVLKGFIVGLALTILVGQLPKLLGVEKPESNVFGTVARLIVRLPDAHALTALVGLGALTVLLFLRRVLPVVPGALVVVVVGVATSAWLDLAGRGVEVVGEVEAGLPSPGLPASSWRDYLELLGPAAGVLLVGFVEGLAAGKAYAARSGYPLDVDRELVALGGANLGSGVVGGMVVNGSLSKTAVNGAAGARSQLSGLVVAALTVVTLLLLTGLFEQLPEAVLAAIVIAAVVELVDLGSLRRLYRVWSAPLGRIYRVAARADFIAAVGALVGVLVLEVLPGLLVGVLLSLTLLLYRASRPNVARLVPVPPGIDVWVDVERRRDLVALPGVAVLRVEGALFFANADHVREHLLLAADGVRALVLDAGTVPSVDVTAAEMLGRVAGELDDRGVQLHLATARGQVRDVLAAAGDGALEGRMHTDAARAVAAAGATE